MFITQVTLPYAAYYVFLLIICGTVKHWLNLMA